MVQRYEAVCVDGFADIESDDTGDLVEYADYAALRAVCAELLAIVESQQFDEHGLLKVSQSTWDAMEKAKRLLED